MQRRPRPRLNHERRVLIGALMTGLPAVILSFTLLFIGDYSAKARWTFGGLAVLMWLGFAFGVREQVVHPLQTLANLLGALREEDFSFRARVSRGDDAMNDVLREVNALAATLHEQRLGAVEASALLHTVMEEIDVAVFSFDVDERLQLVNRAGERLLAQPTERLLGRSAPELGLNRALASVARVIEMAFPGESGRFEVRHGTFRQGGRPHELLVLSNVSGTLREEERQAWQRLIRVIGHELNNSLAPIKSIAASLGSVLRREPRPSDADEDVYRGLEVIRTRSESLSRFMDAYARLARLPAPKLAPLEVGGLMRRVVGLATTHPRVELEPGPPLSVVADGDQLEQLLINLLRNAVDAALETGGGVRVGWTGPSRSHPHLVIWLEDEGPGLQNTANLFVPFFTTKPEGSGIGLVLSRQIAEAHGGTLKLANRKDVTGCRAELRLPLPQPSEAAAFG